MITVWADKYLRAIDSYLPDEVALHLFDPEDGLPNPGDLQHAQALLIRTVNSVNEDTWEQIPPKLEFIGTGSAGTDHVDQFFLQAHDISFADAGGCNARSVAEYVATTLLIWAENNQINLENKSLGIIGVGHVGTEVNAILEPLGLEIILYDPPKAKRDKKFVSVDLTQVLAADILSFHTPLTKTGDYPTFHWLNKDKLAKENFDLIINTARGGVIDEIALLDALKNGKVIDAILDVWEGEPCFNDDVARSATIRTPHIAGYSKQAKHRASQLVAASLCRHFDLDYPDSESQDCPNTQIQIPEFKSTNYSLSEILSFAHPIYEYETELVKLIGLPSKNKGYRFNKLRAEFPLRDEFGYLSLPSAILEEYPVFQKLGFRQY